MDRVFVVQGAESFPASSQEQFYVSATRARERLLVFTDDKAGLRRAIQRSDPKTTATELLEVSRQHPAWVAWLVQMHHAFVRRIRSIPDVTRGTDAEQLREQGDRTMTDGLQVPDLPRLEVLEGYQAFGLTPTFGDLFMLEVRLKTGQRIGLPYPWLGQVLYDPPELSLVFTTGATVVLEGSNLTELFESLLRHQAVYIQEADRPAKELVQPTQPVIDSIAVSFGSKLPA